MSKPTRAAQRWVVKVVPHMLQQNPFEGFTAVLLFLAGLTQLLQPLDKDDTVMRELFPYYIYTAWSVLLVFGGLSIVVGLFGFTVVYRFGLRILGLVTLVYGVALIAASGLQFVFVSGMLLALSAASYLKLLTMNVVYEVTNTRDNGGGVR